jgi:alkylated DNA nucleotide flippase Atl1
MSYLDEVRRIVDAVPPGQVITYGEIAALIGIGPRQAGRLVGQLGGCSPWWRVVYRDGSPATCHDGTALSLLLQESAPMCDDRVDIGRTRGQRPGP